jgi:nucleoside-triphosphatase THEP1
LPNDNIYLAIGENIIGSEGNYITFTGLPGSGKSTFISGIISSFITRTCIFNFNALSYEIHNKTRICLFDTEQGNLSLQRKIKVIKKLSRTNDIYKTFDLFTVLEHEAKTVIRLIITYLENTPECAILIIDGLLDLANGMFNDERESNKLIKWLRKIAKKYKVLLITVLHLGKKDNTALGHLGSASTRYCQSELEVSKTKEGTYKCIAKKTRDAVGFEEIEIRYSEIEKNFVII